MFNIILEPRECRNIGSIGDGIGWLVSAITCSRAGAQVTVLEAASELYRSMKILMPQAWTKQSASCTPSEIYLFLDETNRLIARSFRVELTGTSDVTYISLHLQHIGRAASGVIQIVSVPRSALTTPKVMLIRLFADFCNSRAE